MTKKPAPLECKTEKDFVDHVESYGCWCLKLNPLGRVGIPDRLCIGPCGFILFVELKRLGKKPSKIQYWFHRELRKFGFTVAVPDNITDAAQEFNIRLLNHLKKQKNDQSTKKSDKEKN